MERDNNQRRLYLIEKLIEDMPEYKDIEIPEDEDQQEYLLRGLFNVREPGYMPKEFYEVQDEYLRIVNEERGILELSDLEKIAEDTYIFQGDITRLKVGAIVNAANSGMTGCYRPNHSCIDNCIHTYAGIQLRSECDRMMQLQGHPEPTGQAKITNSYNLPCDHVIHTVGPIVHNGLTPEHERLLASCYRECLKLADENEVKSIAFCCISTGVFMFPNERAAEIAIKTVRSYKEETGSKIEVIFNVFKDEDDRIYRRLLG